MSYHDVLFKQRRAQLEADVRAGRRFPQPSRITLVLDVAGLDGPEVDEACLAKEPAVDNWELGSLAPSWEQLCALAELTRVTPEFLFADPTPIGGGIICGKNGCETVPTVEPVPPFSPDVPLAVVVPLRPRGGAA